MIVPISIGCCPLYYLPISRIMMFIRVCVCVCNNGLFIMPVGTSNSCRSTEWQAQGRHTPTRSHITTTHPQLSALTVTIYGTALSRYNAHIHRLQRTNVNQCSGTPAKSAVEIVLCSFVPRIGIVHCCQFGLTLLKPAVFVRARRKTGEW